MSTSLVALYSDTNNARQAVEALVSGGFDRAQINIVANNIGDHATTHDGVIDNTVDAVPAGKGAGFGAVVGTVVSLGALLIPGIGPVIAAGPLLALLGVGAASGAITGGLTAALIKTGVTDEDANYYAEGIRRGGSLVSLVVEDAQVSGAEEILNRYNPVNVDEVANYYRESGYKGYNTDAEPYTAEEIALERERLLQLNQSGTMVTGSIRRRDIDTTGSIP